MGKKRDQDRKTVKTNLSIHPELEDRMSNFQKEYLNDEIKSLSPLKIGDVNISTDYIFDLGDKYEASVFIRNGSKQPIKFDKMLFFLENKKGEKLGEKLVGLKDLGTIPAFSVRPWKIYFRKDEVDLKDNDLKDIQVTFDVRIKAYRTLKYEFENFPEDIDDLAREKYEKFLEKLPQLRPGQFGITTYDVVLDKQGNLSIVLILRNSSKQKIRIEKLPIIVKDANGLEVARGLFKLDDKSLTIGSVKARLCRFVFPKESLTNQNVDLSNWTVDFE